MILRTIPSSQRGAVLIVALLFLVILTVLGVTAMTAATFEEKMSGNTRDANVAFQAAEAALRDARRDINTIVIPPFTAARVPVISGASGFGNPTGTAGTCSGVGLCYPAAAGPNPPLLVKTAASSTYDMNMTAAPSVAYGTYTGMPPLGSVAAQPRYIIEVLCLPATGATIGGTAIDFCNFYRVTARGYGANPNTIVTLQEVYLKP